MTLVPARLIGDNRPESSPWSPQSLPGPAMREHAMTFRRTAVIRRLTPLALPLVLAGPLALTGCSAGAETSPGPQAEAIAGGGSRDGDGPADRVRIGGTLRDIDVSDDDVVRVLVDEDGPVIWCIGGDSVDRLEPKKRLGHPAQIAATGDGVIYVSASRGVWQVAADGSTTRIVGNGERGRTKDGARATGRTGTISGLAVDPRGRVVYAEQSSKTLIRRVEHGRVHTLAKVPGGPYGTLAAGKDGIIYLAGEQGVRAIAPDGTLKPVPATGGTAPIAIEDHGPDHPGNLSVDDAGLLVGTWERPARLIRPDGTVTTVAWHGRTPALHEGRIYAAMLDPNRGILIAAINLP